MKKLRDLIVLLVVAAAFAISLSQFRRAFGVASPWFGLMVMLTFVGLVAFARPLFLLKLPAFLRKEREWETKGRLYKALRVPVFGELLRRTPLRYLNSLVYLKQNPDPSIVQAQIESAEAAHLLAAAIVVPYMAYACVRSWWSAVAWLMVVQIAFNLYPILHLRWVRIRINRLHDRILSRRTAGA
jgi:Glycosyl-4,4'-diaponeurosporenoate acyltransferase